VIYSPASQKERERARVSQYTTSVPTKIKNAIMELSLLFTKGCGFKFIVYLPNYRFEKICELAW
jgi:hypothetical protein